MTVWNSVAEWQAWRRTLSKQSIGFVPTMGALHRGHASLVERCRQENDLTVVSIFVNPSQFNDARDLTRYPRTIEHDLDLLRDLEVDHVLVPDALEVYPHGLRLRVEADENYRVMEGAYRPGFLTGVMTVVLKLFGIVQPERAYFGKKDYQQLKAIEDLAREFFLRIEIVPCETIREESGLAESSRNRLLPDAARRQAAVLHRTLTGAASASEARSRLEKEGLAVEYVEEHWGRRLAAVTLDGVRLIDNVPVPEISRCS